MNKKGKEMSRINKVIIILTFCFSGVIPAFTQLIPKNTWAVGTDVSLFVTLNSDDPSGSVYLAPLVEYYPVNNLGIGFKGILDYSKLNTNGVTDIKTERILQPYLKYFFYKGFSVLAGTQYVLEFNYQPNLHWGVGYNHFFGNRVALTPLLEFNHNFYQFAARPFHINFALGAGYYFK